MSGSDPVAAFWRPLRAEVEQSGVSRRRLGELLRLSPSALSELLNGRRAKAPDWDVVRTVVEACGGSVAYWRRRYEELEAELRVRQWQEATQGAQQLQPEGPVAVCQVCQDKGPRLVGDGWIESVAVLVGPDETLLAQVRALGKDPLRSLDEVHAFQDRFTRVSRQLLRGLGRTVREACRPHRAQLLRAAQGTILIEGCVNGPLPQSVVSAGRELDPGLLFQRAWTVPFLVTAQAPPGRHVQVLRHYTNIAQAMGGVSATETVRRECARIYHNRLAELTAECPELFVWVNLRHGPDAALAVEAFPDGDARDRLRRLYRELPERNRGLEGLELLLRAMARRTPPPVWPTRLSELYRSELNRPISPMGGTEGGSTAPRFPTLSQGYVNPAFRADVHSDDARPHVDAWWNTRPLHDDIQGFLAQYLSGVDTTEKSLVILGDPGVGKSLLTRLLAAHLPPSDYLPIRVELRNVTADADILEQIAQSLLRLTHKSLTWDDVTSDDVLPVLILDGFDELVQAGGADHWHFLEDIAEFQRRSAAMGLPVAAIVTSRTVVADQARIPKGSVVIRLEPFDTARIARWTDVWNTLNDGRGIRPLRRDLGTLHPELAPQPLLLLMLALYHAVLDETDPDASAPMNRVTLYERLLTLFVRRQIRKLHPRIRPEALEQKVEDELDLLSVIAVAMFNRGQQGVTAEEAERDLGFLRAPDRTATPARPHLLFGQFFFFVHEAKATFEDGADRIWYEFLHATFGEFLVARKIARTLAHCPDGGPYDGLLFALLSFAPLTDRAQIIENLRDLLPPTTPVGALFPESLLPPAADTGYTTGRVPVTYRHACYSANLLILALAAGDTVRFSELSGGQVAWRACAELWRSQFTPASWEAFTEAVGAIPGTAPRQDLTLCLGHQDGDPAARTMFWGFDGNAVMVLHQDPRAPLRRVRMLEDRDLEHLLESALPVFNGLESLTNVFVSDGFGGQVSAANALVALLLCPPAPHEQLLSRYATCVRVLGARLKDTTARARFVDLMGRRLAAESESLPLDTVQDLLRRLTWLGAAFDTKSDGDTFEGTRVALLACACRTFARGPGVGMVAVIGTLLGRGLPGDLLPMEQALSRGGGEGRPTSAAAVVDLLTGALLPTIDRARARGTRSHTPLRLLKLAVALDLRPWCDQYATRVLDTLNPALWDRLLPFEADYLRASLHDPGLTARLDARSRGPHP